MLLLNIFYTIAAFIIAVVMIIALPFALLTGFVIATVMIIYLLIKDYQSNK
jgi:hypothetical protein